MNADPCRFESPVLRASPVKARSVAPGHSELVLMQAGRDIWMGFRGHVGIHADRESRRFAKMGRPRRQQFQFAGAFHIEQKDAGTQREIDFIGLLADSREDHAARRFSADLSYPLQLAARHDIETRAQPLQQPQDGKVGIRLYGIADAVFATAKCLVELLIALMHRRAGIHVQRRAVVRSQLAQR